VTPEEIGIAITAELIALRRHATAALPHLSWFKAAAQTAATSDSAVTVNPKPDSKH
jgi:xanthine/CO dehydrogenase XdhC/CoxF family maturation factor